MIGDFDNERQTMKSKNMKLLSLTLALNEELSALGLVSAEQQEEFEKIRDQIESK